MSYKDIARISQDMQGLALVGNSYSLAKKKKAKIGDFVKTGTTNIVGINLMREQGKFIESL